MRLNPFAFPSDTTFRFLLLIAAIVGVSLLAFDWLYGQFADLRAEAAALIACGAGLPTDPTQVATDAQLVAFRSCLAAVNGTRLDAVLFGVVALVIGGGVAYAHRGGPAATAIPRPRPRRRARAGGADRRARGRDGGRRRRLASDGSRSTGGRSGSPSASRATASSR